MDGGWVGVCTSGWRDGSVMGDLPIENETISCI